MSDTYENIYDTTRDAIALRLVNVHESHSVRMIRHEAHEATSEILTAINEAVSALPTTTQGSVSRESVCLLLGFHAPTTTPAASEGETNP